MVVAGDSRCVGWDVAGSEEGDGYCKAQCTPRALQSLFCFLVSLLHSWRQDLSMCRLV